MAGPVIITGFRPFPGVDVNPSAVLIESLRDSPLPEPPISTRLLDTVYDRMADRIDALLKREPSALIMTGYSSLARGLKIETRATSRFTRAHADANGLIPEESRDPVTTAPNLAIDFPFLVNILRAADLPAALSQDAGAYVCNHAYFLALDRIARGQLRTRALFVHLPAIAGMRNGPRGASTMPLGMMRRAMAILATAVTSRHCDEDARDPQSE